MRDRPRPPRSEDDEWDQKDRMVNGSTRMKMLGVGTFWGWRQKMRRKTGEQGTDDEASHDLEKRKGV